MAQKFMSVTKNMVSASAVMGASLSWTLVSFGKSKVLILQAMITIIGSWMKLIGIYPTFWTGSAVMGLAFGMSNAVSPMFISEISPSKLKGVYISMVPLWMNIGLLIPLVMNFFLPSFFKPDSSVPDYCLRLEGKHVIWSEITAIPMLISLIQLMFLIFIFKKENPIYMDHLSWKSGSSENSSEMSDEDSDVGNLSSFNMQQSSQSAPLTSMEKDTWKTLKASKEIRKMMAWWMVSGVLQLSGIDLVLNYSFSFMFSQEGMQINMSLMITALSLIYTPMSMMLLMFWSSKVILLIGTIMACAWTWVLFQLSAYLSFKTYTIVVLKSLPNMASSAAIFAFTLSFWLTTASTIYVYWGEVLTDKGMSMATAWHWFFNTMVSFLPILAFMMKDISGEKINFWDANSVYFFMFSGMSILGFFLITMYVKETKGKSSSEISELFGSKNFGSLDSELKLSEV